jgi:hypothetical protein
LQIGLAGANMYIFARVLRMRIPAALLQRHRLHVQRLPDCLVVFTMFIAAVVWLPLLLAVIEWMIRKQEEKGATGYSPIPYVVFGALVVGVMILAGHPELIYYTLLVAGAYSGVRLLAAWRINWTIKDRRSCRPRFVFVGNCFGPRIFDLRSSFFVLVIFRLAVWLLVMVFLGVALGAIQLIPLLELVPMNFREGRPVWRRCASGPGRRGMYSPSRCPTSSAVPAITAGSISGHASGLQPRSTHWANPSTTFSGASRTMSRAGIIWGW